MFDVWTSAHILGNDKYENMQKRKNETASDAWLNTWRTYDQTNKNKNEHKHKNKNKQTNKHNKINKKPGGRTSWV